MASGRIKGITIEIGGDTTKLVSSLKNVDTQIKNTQTVLKDVNKLLKLDPGNTELLRQKQQALTDAIGQTRDRLSQLKDAQSQVAQGSAEWDALQREIIETEQSLQGLEDELSDFGSVGDQKLKVLGDKFKEVGDKVQEVGKKIQDAGDKISSLGADLSAKVTAPIVGGLAACTKGAVDFEDAMAKVNTIADTSETGVALEDLEKQITSLSDETGVAATEIADNVYNAISAGQQTGDAVNFVGEATKLAVAGFAETGDALDILTTIMNAYGLEAEDVTRVSDVLINTQNLGKTTVAELSSAMGKAIPTAKANGVEIEDLAGAYAVMTSNGIATAETTTYLNSMMNELGKQGTSAAKAFAAGTEHIKEGGLTMAEAMESGWELTDVLSILDEAAAESGTTIANMFGSAEAGKAASVLWDNAEKLNDAVTAMGDSAGATDEAFSKMDTTSRQAQIALNQLKNSAIDLGGTVLTMLAPYFEQVVGKIKEVTEWFKNLDDSQKEQIVKIAAIVAAIGPALMIIGKLVSGIGAIIAVGGQMISGITAFMTKIGGLQGLLAALTSPIGIIIAAIAALTAAFVYFYNTNDQFREKVNAVFEQVKETISVFVEEAKVWFQGFLESCQPIFDAFNELGAALSEFFQALVPVLMELFSEIGAGIKTFLDEHKAEIDFFFGVIKEVVSTAFDVIKTVITTVLNVITGIVRAFTSLLKGDWKGALDHLKNAAKSALDGIVSIFKRLGEMLKNIFGDLLAKFKQWGADMISNFINGIKEKWQALKDTVAAVGQSIKDFLGFSEPKEGPLSNFHTYAPDMMKLFAQGIKDNAYLITDAIGSSFDLRPYLSTMNSGINKLNNTASSSMEAQASQGPVVVNISLQGDAKRLFQVLSEEAHRDWQITGQSRLMGY